MFSFWFLLNNIFEVKKKKKKSLPNPLTVRRKRNSQICLPMVQEE